MVLDLLDSSSSLIIKLSSFVIIVIEGTFVTFVQLVTYVTLMTFVTIGKYVILVTYATFVTLEIW